MSRVIPDLHKIGRGWNAGGKTAKRWGRKNPIVVFAQRNPKEIKKILRLLVVARKAAAVPPLGPTLGQYGIPITRFCDQFNASSVKFTKGTQVLVLLYQTYDNAFFFDIHPPTTSFLLKRVCGIKKGSGQAGQMYNAPFLREYKQRKRLEDVRKQTETGQVLEVENKYSSLDKKPRARTKRRRRKKKSRSRTQYTKHQNVVGRTRFSGVTPQMLYEVCLIKYIQYMDGGSYAIPMELFNALYTSDRDGSIDKNRVHVETRAAQFASVQNIGQDFRYVKAYRGQEYVKLENLFGEAQVVCAELSRMYFRRVQGTMRSMGLFPVPYTTRDQSHI